MIIESRSNPIVKSTRALLAAKERRQAGLHLIEGEKLVRDAIVSGAPLTDLFLLDGQTLPAPDGVRVHTVTQSVLESICDAKTPQGVVAIVKTPGSALPARFPEGLIVLLDGVQDPGNVGAIIRSADAFGACGVLLSPACADPYAPKTLRAAMGSTYHLPVWQAELSGALNRLEEQGYQLLCGHLHGSPKLPALSKKLALVIGSEGSGVSETVAARCIRYRLPMPGRAESLNASVAAGILIYLASNRRAE